MGLATDLQPSGYVMRHFFDDVSAAHMHAQDLLQLAAILAVQSPNLETRKSEWTRGNLASYWSASKRRIDSWGRYLRQGALDDKEQPAKFTLTAILEEIVLSEPLTRIWTAISAAGHQSRDLEKSVAVAEYIMKSHLEVRDQAMVRLSTGDQDEQTVADIVRLDRCTARWTDLLLAYVEQNYPASHLAPNPERSLDFFQDLQDRSSRLGQEVSSAITLATMRETICDQLQPQSPHMDLNFQIGAAILDSCAGPVLSHRLFESLWTIRLIHTTAQCQQMLADYLHPSSCPVVENPIGNDLSSPGALL